MLKKKLQRESEKLVTEDSMLEVPESLQVQKDIASSVVNSNTINDRGASGISEEIGKTKTVNQVNDRNALEKMEEIGKTVNYVNDQDESAVDPNIVTEFVQASKTCQFFCQANVARNKLIIAKQAEITAWCLFSERFEDKVVELRSNDKKLTKPYLTGVSDGYLRVMTCKGIWFNRVTCSADKISRFTNPQIEFIIEQVKSKTSDHQSRVNEIVATTSAHDSDDNFSDTSDDTDYFKEEEGANDSIEEGSKADDDDDVYFHSEDEEEKGTNEESVDPDSIGWKSSRLSYDIGT
ncbi:22366_t:CDS:2 [Rhizophagus irregularis]|nr:22366_t:CDS:2 [Rhizophagus irregularis]